MTEDSYRQLLDRLKVGDQYEYANICYYLQRTDVITVLIKHGFDIDLLFTDIIQHRIQQIGGKSDKYYDQELFRLKQSTYRFLKCFLQASAAGVLPPTRLYALVDYAYWQVQLIPTAGILDTLEDMAFIPKWEKAAEQALERFYQHLTRPLSWVFSDRTTDYKIKPVSDVHGFSQTFLRAMNKVAIRTGWSWINKGRLPVVERSAAGLPPFPVSLEKTDIRTIFFVIQCKDKQEKLEASYDDYLRNFASVTQYPLLLKA
ncbi:hypothetical protein, partial [Sansalvadorimonas verongulae]|uniref:hypothetical protein n=1 Tax=Sansalvadorimonas verongulae TaxID=2172824 RepID=UPI001E5A7754